MRTFTIFGVVWNWAEVLLLAFCCYSAENIITMSNTVRRRQCCNNYGSWFIPRRLSIGPEQSKVIRWPVVILPIPVSCNFVLHMWCHNTAIEATLSCCWYGPKPTLFILDNAFTLYDGFLYRQHILFYIFQFSCLTCCWWFVQYRRNLHTYKCLRLTDIIHFTVTLLSTSWNHLYIII